MVADFAIFVFARIRPLAVVTIFINREGDWPCPLSPQNICGYAAGAARPCVSAPARAPPPRRAGGGAGVRGGRGPSVVGWFVYLYTYLYIAISICYIYVPAVCYLQFGPKPKARRIQSTALTAHLSTLNSQLPQDSKRTRRTGQLRSRRTPPAVCGAVSRIHPGLLRLRGLTLTLTYPAACEKCECERRVQGPQGQGRAALVDGSR